MKPEIAEAATSSSKGGSKSTASVSSKDYDESDELLSDYTSDTTFFDDDRTPAELSLNDIWKFAPYRIDGRVHIFGEWVSKSKAYRYAVIGPDWLCVLMTYIVLLIPSVMVYLYLINSLAEEVVFFILLGLCLFGLTAVFLADPGLVRKYHHARSRHWTYCDHCESFRPPGTVHCSTCQVCVAEYDHHCPWTGKCVGYGNLTYFKIFIVALSWLVIFFVVLIILDVADVTR